MRADTIGFHSRVFKSNLSNLTVTKTIKEKRRDNQSIVKAIVKESS